MSGPNEAQLVHLGIKLSFLTEARETLDALHAICLKQMHAAAQGEPLGESREVAQLLGEALVVALDGYRQVLMEGAVDEP